MAILVKSPSPFKPLRRRWSLADAVQLGSDLLHRQLRGHALQGCKLPVRLRLPGLLSLALQRLQLVEQLPLPRLQPPNLLLQALLIHHALGNMLPELRLAHRALLLLLLELERAQLGVDRIEAEHAVAVLPRRALRALGARGRVRVQPGAEVADRLPQQCLQDPALALALLEARLEGAELRLARRQLRAEMPGPRCVVVARAGLAYPGRGGDPPAGAEERRRVQGVGILWLGVQQFPVARTRWSGYGKGSVKGCKCRLVFSMVGVLKAKQDGAVFAVFACIECIVARLGR